MKRHEYTRIPLRLMRGRSVRSLVALRNGYGELPAGTIYEVRDKRSGFGLRSEPCGHCGFQQNINKVRPEEVEWAD